MLKRFITILLLVTLGGLPAAAQVYQLSAEICEAIAQMNSDEEGMSCCLSNGTCAMNQHQPVIAQPTKNCVNHCLCASEPVSVPISVLVNSPQLINLVAVPVTMARPPSVTAQLRTVNSYQIIPVHRSQDTYLHIAKLRL